MLFPRTTISIDPLAIIEFPLEHDYPSSRRAGSIPIASNEESRNRNSEGRRQRDKEKAGAEKHGKKGNRGTKMRRKKVETQRSMKDEKETEAAEKALVPREI